MTKRRHHYIPKFYLNNFIDPENSPYIWVYDKEGADIIKATAKDIAVEKHYFSFTTPEGKKDSETLENALADIEGSASTAINKIIQEKILTQEERTYFVTFLALMLTRVPNFRRNIENATGKMLKKMSIMWASYKKGFEGMMQRYEEDTGEKIGMSTEELRQWMIDGKYDITVDSQFSLGIALSNAEKMVNLFYKMKWAYIKSTDEYKFLTGDNPFYYIDPTYNPKSFYGFGLVNKNIEVTFPLSQNLCAFGSWRGKEGYAQGNNQLVKNINRRTVIASLRFIFASQRSDIIKDFVKKYKNSSPKLVVS